MIAPHRGLMRWWESTTLCSQPCLELQIPVSGVQVHAIEDRVEAYVRGGGRVDMYRLNDVDQLDMVEVEALEEWLRRHFAGRSYDFRGAAISGTRVWSRLRWIFVSNGGLESLFCSEMLAALLMRLSRLDRARKPGWYNPGRLMRRLVRTGVYRLVERIT